MELSIAEKDLYRAIGELAYLIAKSDNQMSKMERIVFQEAIKEELGSESWLAKDRFEMLEAQRMDIDSEKTYHHVLYLLKIHKEILTDEMIEKFINVLEKVGGVSGISEEEMVLLERFINDINKIRQ